MQGPPPLLATWRTRRPLCTDEIFNLARAAPNVCVLNLHGNLSILTENGQCKCLPGQMNGRERSSSRQLLQFPPAHPSLFACTQLVSQRPWGIAPGTRQPALGIVDVSLGIFNTRLHLRLPNVISGTTTAACATVTCPTCLQATPPPYTRSWRPPCRSLWQCNGPQWSNGRLLLSMSLRYQLRTVEFE